MTLTRRAAVWRRLEPEAPVTHFMLWVEKRWDEYGALHGVRVSGGACVLTTLCARTGRARDEVQDAFDDWLELEWAPDVPAPEQQEIPECRGEDRG